jgi:hypothetical protein
MRLKREVSAGVLERLAFTVGVAGVALSLDPAGSAMQPVGDQLW